MQQIALAQWTHDIRNALGTIALYVDTLECPGNPQSSRTVASTQALLARVAAMASGAAKQAGGGPAAARARSRRCASWSPPPCPRRYRWRPTRKTRHR